MDGSSCIDLLYGPQYQYFIIRHGTIKKIDEVEFNTARDEGRAISIHYAIAKKSYPNVSYPDDYVMTKGWAKVGSMVHGGVVLHKMPTKSQLEALHSLGFRSFQLHEDNKRGKVYSIIDKS